jgi:transcription elongation factor GreA
MTKVEGTQSVSVGSWVRLTEHGSGDEEVFHIVQPFRADLLENRLPPDNPLSRALLGQKPGDEVCVNGPQGEIRFSVLEVGRE